MYIQFIKQKKHNKWIINNIMNTFYEYILYMHGFCYMCIYKCATIRVAPLSAWAYSATAVSL